MARLVTMMTMIYRVAVKTALADLSSGVVVVQVHKRPRRVATLGASLPRVDERLGKSAAVGDVVRATGPLEAISGARNFDSPVAAAPVQQSGAARSRDGVRDPGCRNGMHERRFPGTCNDKTARVSWTSHPRRMGPPTMSWLKTMTLSIETRTIFCALHSTLQYYPLPFL